MIICGCDLRPATDGAAAAKGDPLSRASWMSILTLGWLNDTLQTDYSKVEDCGDGVAYLQLADAILPGKVPLERMHFTCRSRDDRERNLNILRHVLKRAPDSVPRAKATSDPNLERSKLHMTKLCILFGLYMIRAVDW